MVTIYWRPGCMFCQRMRVVLWLRRVKVEWINIWSDPAAAEFVRSVADGNETVPTVVMGGETVVNPAPRRVVAAARSAA